MKIVWTPKALETFNSNLDYLAVKWSDAVYLNFIDRVDEVISRIRLNPNLYPLLGGCNDLHRCVVCKTNNLVLQSEVESTNRLGYLLE